jgi:hypothetical protein
MLQPYLCWIVLVIQNNPLTIKYIQNNIPLKEMNKLLTQLKGKAKYYAELSADKAFKELDSGNDDMMNRVLWFAAKGNKKFPDTK